jgi:peptidoglycan/xylan/chitin deacetylase (PgdA/CDA1 family)
MNTWPSWKGSPMLAREVDRVRLDRWVTLSLAAPLGSVVRAKGGAHIPILMYHSIADDADVDVHPYFRTVTTPRVFKQHVRLLRAKGYQTIGLAEAARLLTQAGDGRHDRFERKVVITFDDAFADVHTTAFPILQDAGYTASVFVPTAFIGREFLNRRRCMNATQLRELHRHGFEIGSHSVSHGKLVALPRDALAQELAHSKQAIEDCIGEQVSLFSYPFRFPEANRRFVAMLSEELLASGYRGGVTTTIGCSGPKDNVLMLPRLPVNDRDDDALLGAKLAGHYDWLRLGQRVGKYCREWVQPRRAA